MTEIKFNDMRGESESGRQPRHRLPQCSEATSLVKPKVRVCVCAVFPNVSIVLAAGIATLREAGA